MKLTFQSFKQEGHQMFVGTMSVADLLSLGKVDVYSREGGEEKGYQRAPEAGRALKIARYLQKDPKPLVPTTVLLSYRGSLQYEEKGNNLVEVTLPEGESLWIVDGQHRIFGFRRAIEDLGIERLRDYVLPVVIVENPAITDEANQFRIINETMKKVRTDLARHILAMKLVNEGAVGRRSLREANRLWDAQAVEVYRKLNSDADSPWHGRIQMPNDAKDDRHIVRALSFGTSLKDLLTDVIWSTEPTDRLAEMVKSYWQAWQAVCPECFDDADNYVLLKTPGVFSCHRLLVVVLNALRKKGVTEPKVSDFKKVLADLGEFGRADYWAKENSEGAAMAGSMKGFTLLCDSMADELHEAGW
jgi:DGQHR domain-containing protein